MAKSEEGEFELVLGNKQLISVFLVVVILLAVFFSMGYIVGRSSAPATSAENPRPANKEVAVERAPAVPTPAPEKSAAPAETKPVETKPAEVHPDKPSPVTVQESKPAPKPAADQPPAGDYWQVVATSKEDADIVTRALTKKGFHAVVAPVPGDTRFRVLVGPLANAAAQGQTRSDLEASGFKNPIMRKY